MCEMCDESEDGIVVCQDCQDMICFDNGTAYVTMSGDLFCRRCGRQYDEYELYGDDDNAESFYDFYNEDWYDPSSTVSEVEPADTPRVRYIGPGSEVEDSDTAADSGEE